MSQYPSPYNPPPPPNYGGGYDFNYYQPAEDPLAPAKRASLMMFIMGGLIVLPSFCCAAMGLALPAMMAQQPGALGDLTAAGMTPELVQRMFTIGGAVGLFIGIVMFVLGRFVRRGSMGAAVTSIVMVALIALYLLLNAIGLLVMQLPPPQMVLGLAMSVVGLALLGLLIVWLVQAVIAAPRVATMKSQYQQHYWHYQQQQQMHQSGYAAPPPPMPPTDDPPQEERNGPVT